MKILLTAIVLLAFILRVYALGIVPPGLTNDEADIGYDAYSILLTGHDQWGQFLPTTSFKGFGDYRLPLYTYLVVPVVKVFDLNAFSVRLPSALFGTFSVLLIYFLGKKVFEKTTLSSRAIGLAAATLLAISPWAMGLSRIGIESNVAIAIMLGAFLSFFYAFKNQKLFLVTTVLMATTCYTYTSYALFTPLVIAVCTLFYKKKLMKSKKYMLLSGAVLIFLILPLFIFKSTVGVRAGQILLTNSQDSIGILANLNDRRGSCVERFPAVLCKITENKQLVFGNTFLRNYISHFSPDFLYLNGATNQYSILPQRSLFYTIEMLFLIGGLIFAIKSKNKNVFFVLVLSLLTPIPDALTSDGHYSRASTIIPFILLLEGIGAVYVWRTISAQNKPISPALNVCLVAVVLFSFVSYLLSYFSYFPKYYSSYGQFGYEQWANTINNNKSKYKKIYLSRQGNDTKQYVYYLFYTKYRPAQFQKKTNVSFSTDASGWESIDKIENLYFVDRIPSEDELNEMNSNVLLVTSPQSLPKEFPVQKFSMVRDKNGNILFSFVDSHALTQYYKTYQPKLLP